MFWSVCSAKGGAGASVVAAAVAVRVSAKRRVLLVDFGGDQPDLLGVSDADGPGVANWLTADGGVGVDAVADLVSPVSDSFDLLHWGSLSRTEPVNPGRVVELVKGVGAAGSWDVVVADVGRLSNDGFEVGQLVASASGRTTLVVRACYLGMKRASRLRLANHDVVEIVEGGRALRTLDIEHVLGVPVTCRVPFDPVIARAADAGLLTSRLPRALRRMADDLLAAPAPSAEAAA
jgi:hypothetical protein